jgi:tetratricopeptide (TPR) repeat protein
LASIIPVESLVDSEGTDFWVKTADTHINRGQYNEALLSYNHALNLDPGNSSILTYKEDLLQITGLRESATTVNNLALTNDSEIYQYG